MERIPTKGLVDKLISSFQLSKMRDIELSSCKTDTLVDLRDITIDLNKPVIDRIDSFLQQIKNPYLFKVDDVIVKVKYGSGKTFDESLCTILTME